MLFKNRVDAGRQLGKALASYTHAPDAIVIGLPRGGVILAFEVAKLLHLPLDIICPRKIGAPFNQEFAIGAITETGEGYFDQKTIRALDISPGYLEETIKEEKKEAERRLKTYRNQRPPLNVKNKTVLLIDDGIATGATVKASIMALKKAEVRQIVVAVPVAASDSLKEIETMADEVICLATPPHFHAVGQFYVDFTPTSDHEVCRLLLQNTF